MAPQLHHPQIRPPASDHCASMPKAARRPDEPRVRGFSCGPGPSGGTGAARARRCGCMGEGDGREVGPSRARRSSRSTGRTPWPASTRRPRWGRRGRSPSPAVSTPRCTPGGPGPCASTPASAPPRSPTPATTQLIAHGTTGLSVAFDLPTQMGYDSDSPIAQRRGRQGRRGDRLDRGHADALRRHPARRGVDVDDDQRPRRACCCCSTSSSPRSRASTGRR